MVTRGVLERVLQIRFNGATASSFAIEVDGRQYLVTARHVVETITDSLSIELYRGGSWDKQRVRVVGFGINHVDVAVLALDQQVVPAGGIDYSTVGLSLGGAAYFLGFPYGLNGGSHLPTEFPLALVRSATVAAFIDREPGVPSFMLLDGHNNPGFSGGPVVFEQITRRKEHLLPDGTRALFLHFQLAGVVSAYRYEREPVLAPAGQTGLFINQNTGLVVAEGIGVVVDAIRANPIGPVVTPRKDDE